MSDSIPQLGPNCIQPNPDIAGIGVRTAVYAQNFLALIFAVLGLRDRYVTWKELLAIEGQSMSILLTACALLLSAVVQTVTLGTSTYHAMIILNLAWMNNTNTFVYAIIFRYQGISQVSYRPQLAPLSSALKSETAAPPRRKAMPLFAIGSLHLSFVAGFGLWIWSTIDTFNASVQCSPDLPISLVVLGHRILLGNPILQKVSFAIYGVIAVPVVNVAIAVGVIYAIALVLATIVTNFVKLKPRSALYLPGYIALGILAMVNVIIVIDTETMVHYTKPYVDAGESKWTFGQTLAIFLLILPIKDIISNSIGEDERLAQVRQLLDRKWEARKKRKREKTNPNLGSLKEKSPSTPVNTKYPIRRAHSDQPAIRSPSFRRPRLSLQTAPVHSPRQRRAKRPNAPALQFQISSPRTPTTPPPFPEPAFPFNYRFWASSSRMEIPRPEIAVPPKQTASRTSSPPRPSSSLSGSSGKPASSSSQPFVNPPSQQSPSPPRVPSPPQIRSPPHIQPSTQISSPSSPQMKPRKRPLRPRLSRSLPSLPQLRSAFPSQLSPLSPILTETEPGTPGQIISLSTASAKGNADDQPKVEMREEEDDQKSEDKPEHIDGNQRQARKDIERRRALREKRTRVRIFPGSPAL